MGDDGWDWLPWAVLAVSTVALAVASGMIGGLL